MVANYAYPIDSSWSKADIVSVVNFLASVEKAHEQGIPIKDIVPQYQAFKEVVDSISGEKKIDREFKQTSGYSVYQVTKQIKLALKDNVDQSQLIKIS